jgi:peptide/nickel transport system substrate-binding protein
MQKQDTRERQGVQATINRRDFLLQSAAVGLAVGASSASLGKPARAETPKKGGHLRLGSSHGSTTDSLDPATSSNDLMTSVFYTAYSQLTEVNAKGELEPLLAESISVSDDAVTWTFDLRKGIEFHNGKPFGADDVIATMNHHRGEDSKSVMNSIANQIAEMSKDGDHRVVFKLQQGNADFPFLLSATQFGVMPATDGKVDPLAGVGTGAYAIKSFEPGVRIEYARNPNFFKPDRAYFDTAEVLVIADPVARQTALISGEIDVMDRVELKTVNLLEKQPGVQVVDVAGTLHYTFPMRTDTPPFDNNDVRLALKYAVDREDLLQKILRGYGTLGNDHPISPANPYHASGLEQRVYDPDKAKFHMKKAGLSELNVDLSAADAGFPGAVDAATLYQAHAKKAGININVAREPNDGYWSNVWMKKPWCAAYWSGRPTEDWMFTDAYSVESNWNDSFWKDERFNRLLKEARATLDPGKRGEMYAEMQTLVRDQGGVVIPMFANHVLAHSDKLAHDEHVAGNWDKDGGKLLERWWFA